MIKKDVIAILLAGGQGSRLDPLTRNIAKPALPFGGGYKIIDFTLSNCTNSGIDTIGVLVQYKPLELNSYLSMGKAWNLDRINGGITILPPYRMSNDMVWYRGTANAVYHNYEYIEHYNPENVLILSGDHVYKMNYLNMLEFHKERDADITIGVVPVPLKEASRFGILDTDKDMKITGFQEKPQKPKGRMASMGIYIYKWSLLKEYLSNGENCTDFGKHIIPKMISDKKRVYAYQFNGYWRDIGTIDSYWAANMDLLKKFGRSLIYDKKWPIYSVNSAVMPQYLSGDAVIKNSVIASGAEIHGRVINSIISRDTYVGPGAIIRDSVILPEVQIEDNANIEKSIIGSKTIVGDSVNIGISQNKRKSREITVIADNCDIVEGSIITDGRIINREDNVYTGDELSYA
ncbi:MAG: glucose-1-phosphate adenylyltransferase [Halanaerobiales bacterium]